MLSKVTAEYYLTEFSTECLNLYILQSNGLKIADSKANN